jgi:phage shock protein A
MSTIRRWKMSVTSWVDGVLSQIENHEASVNAAIGRIRQSTARARVQLKRVERDRQRLEQSLHREEEAAVRWRDRAGHESEDARAIECLRRHKAAARRADGLRQRLAEHERAHEELCDGIRILDTRLGELTERKNLMRTRQSRAEAAHGMVCAGAPMGDLEDVFERWESRVGEIEIASEVSDPIDAFERSFDLEEDETALRAELVVLRAGREQEGAK